MTKWALVTGAAKRIGRVIALDLAKAGWNIIAHYHTSADDAAMLAKEIQKLGREVCLAEIDLASSKPVANLIPSLTAEIGPIGVLINNASLFVPDDKSADDRHALINTEAPRLLSEAFLQQTPADHTGVIVNLLDADPSKSNFGAYNASKKALHAMTLEMGLRFAPRVRVNGVAIGAALPNPRESETHFQAMVKASPLQQQISPQSVASAIRFLIENPAIVGDVIHVDGGVHLQVKR